jgi:hypothetical protein
MKYTARQRAAFSFTALVRSGAPWRDIDVELLSFTRWELSPGGQLFPSIDVTLRKLYIRPGDEAGLGFAAVDEADAVELEAAWKELLAPPPRRQVASHRRPSLRKD